MALESSMLALGSACCSPPLSAVFLPTNRRRGCLGTAAGSSAIASSTSGPRFVAARSSSIVVGERAHSGVKWDAMEMFVGLTLVCSSQPLTITNTNVTNISHTNILQMTM